MNNLTNFILFNECLLEKKMVKEVTSDKFLMTPLHHQLLNERSQSEIVFFQCFVHHRRICKLSIHSQSFPTFPYPVHNTGKLMGDNIFCKIRVDFVFGNLDVEMYYQESPVKTVGSVIDFRKFVKAEYHIDTIQNLYIQA